MRGFLKSGLWFSFFALGMWGGVLIAEEGNTLSYIEIEDEADLPLLNPEFQQRRSAKIRLPNGLEAFLISDPKADQSAAALAVRAGSWDDPDDCLGIAHFCEHMLFAGSKKYPGENEFDLLVSDYGGLRNAYTGSDRTVYLFSAHHEGFPKVLDCFSRFFIDPLFDPSRLSRELCAVDQEYAKDFESEAWRKVMVFLDMGNPAHPNSRFSIGNAETLGAIPRARLQEWFRSHYSADQMQLVLYSASDLEELKRMVCASFSEIPVCGREEREWAPLSSEEQRGHLVAIVPRKEMQELSLVWELPGELCNDSKAAFLLADFLGQGHEYSLYEQLKREGLADVVSVSVEQEAGPDHLFFTCVLGLTEQGMKQLDQAVLLCFQAFAGVCESGIPQSFFEERDRMDRLEYQHQERGDAYLEVSVLAGEILDEPLVSFPRKLVGAGHYDPTQIAQILSFLTPERLMLVLQASPEKTGIAPDRKEPWMGVEYAVAPFSEESMALWRSAKPHPNIVAPESNPFAPKNFDLVVREGEGPQKIADEPAGVAYYDPSLEFPTPSIVYSFDVYTPLLASTPESVCLTQLFCEALKEQFFATMAAAAAAKLNFTLVPDARKLRFVIEGFSDQSQLLLERSVEQLAALALPTREQFERYQETVRRSLENQLSSLSYKRALQLVTAFANPDQPLVEEQVEAFERITYEQFCVFLRGLLDEAYVEAFFTGNVTKEDALRNWEKVRGTLCKVPFEKERHVQRRHHVFSGGEGPFVYREKRGSTFGNSAVLMVDQGLFSHKRRAAQKLLADVLEPAFFEALRTQQKTGYIVCSFCDEDEEVLSHYLFVQSDSHHPDELLYRFEFFLETELEALCTSVSAERFSILKQSLLNMLRTGARNMVEQNVLRASMAFKRKGDFGWLDKMIEGVESLSYEEFLEEARGFFARSNRKRVAVLVEGHTEDPYVYEPTLLRKVGVE